MPNKWFSASQGVCSWKVLWKFKSFSPIRQVSETLNVTGQTSATGSLNKNHFQLSTK
jgi:hypothetical protein